MTAKTHQIIGISSGITYFILTTPPAYNPATFGSIVVFSYIASLLPDIDQPTSKLWHLLPFGHTFAKISDPFLEHRNITHSILGTVIVSLGFYYLFKIFPDYWGINTHLLLVCTLIAYSAHLITDMFTNEGIPLFFPFHRFFGIPPKPLDGFRVATGKWFENFVVFPIITLYLISFIAANHEQIKKILIK